MDYSFRKACAGDEKRIADIFDEARKRIAPLGIDQWQGGYPNIENAIADIENGTGFVLTNDEGVIVAYASLGLSGDKNYDTIEGKWISSGRYGVIHRVAVSDTALRKKAASTIMLEMEKECVRCGFEWARIDTHKGNIPMRAMVESLGYIHCGVITLLDGEGGFREAYEKKLV